MSPYLIALIPVVGLVGLAALAFWWDHGRRVDVQSVVPEVPAPVGPPPEISCFVKGLILSMQTTPSDWTYHHEASGRRWVGKDGPRISWHRTSWTHTSGMKVSVTERDGDTGAHIDYHGLSSHEMGPLLNAIESYLETPRVAAIVAQRAAERAEYEAKRAAERAPFEALGCPSVHESPPSQST